MKSKLKIVKRTKQQKLYDKQPRVIEAEHGFVFAVYRHADKQILRVGDELYNKVREVITGFYFDTKFEGGMYVATNLTTDLNRGISSVARIVLKPKLLIV